MLPDLQPDSWTLTGTLGGTLLAVLASIQTEDLANTSILAFVDAVVSYSIVSGTVLNGNEKAPRLMPGRFSYRV